MPGLGHGGVHVSRIAGEVWQPILEAVAPRIPDGCQGSPVADLVPDQHHMDSCAIRRLQQAWGEVADRGPLSDVAYSDVLGVVHAKNESQKHPQWQIDK